MLKKLERRICFWCSFFRSYLYWTFYNSYIYLFAVFVLNQQTIFLQSSNVLSWLSSFYTSSRLQSDCNGSFYNVCFVFSKPILVNHYMPPNHDWKSFWMLLSMIFNSNCYQNAEWWIGRPDNSTWNICMIWNFCLHSFNLLKVGCNFWFKMYNRIVLFGHSYVSGLYQFLKNNGLKRNLNLGLENWHPIYWQRWQIN